MAFITNIIKSYFFRTEESTTNKLLDTSKDAFLYIDTARFTSYIFISYTYPETELREAAKDLHEETFKLFNIVMDIRIRVVSQEYDIDDIIRLVNVACEEVDILASKLKKVTDQKNEYVTEMKNLSDVMNNAFRSIKLMKEVLLNSRKMM